MKLIIALCVIVFFTSCKTIKEKDFELISYFWSWKNNSKNDTMAPYIRCNLYAKINKRNCVLILNDSSNKRQYKSFSIDRNILIDFYKQINQINTDTILTNKSLFTIYDGPSIKTIYQNKKGNPIKISFDNSSRSDLKYRQFYNYIDSVSKNSKFSVKIDTVGLHNAQNKLIENIFETDKVILPLIIKDTSVLDY